MSEKLVIYYNDSIDSDNSAAALALMRATAGRADTRVIWILEPRQVSLGLTMTGEQRVQCLKLIERHFPTRGRSFKVLLGGLLNEADLDGIDGLSAQDRELLRLAVKPENGPKEDAILHGRLTAWDQVTCMAGWANAPVEVLMDLESLDGIQNPVNLNFHHKEELVSRSEEELKSHQEIMTEPLAQRVESLKSWYSACIERAERKMVNQGSSVRPLDYDALCQTIKNSTSVQFFGGSSLAILQRFIQSGVADRVKCHLQAGSCDLSVNLFPNQFNIALNPKAAKFVFDHFTAFSNFTVVPSHTAQGVKYPLAGLKKEGGTCLEKRFLGFNCLEDPLKIATRKVTLEQNYPDKICPMPDLTAFLCALSPGFGGSTLGYAQLDDYDGTFIFRPDTSGIPMYDIADASSVTEAELVEVLASLAR
ncbi:hypothetical protein BGZ61DRAFT_388757 [Ilyonectria robusta]|uniref:uncharacterized protein n=1 Tax=Ilyonectria robusta TaxID=1079257 RepID=UPI001E8D488C|nr:uncharacterized protein BGZ61DRAFT_388757 [Ilyonectria robusta]KAH8706414.1 hypothetical protein BGZ61DRAFT_388757 [Ilyonectria robusta]